MSRIDTETPEQFNEKVKWFKSICEQLNDVRLLKDRYNDENNAMNYVPRWKQSGSEVHSNQKPNPVSTAVRMSPCLTQEEMTQLHSSLAEGVYYSIPELHAHWGGTYDECRRRLFWLVRKRVITQNATNHRYRRREEHETKWRHSQNYRKPGAYMTGKLEDSVD